MRRALIIAEKICWIAVPVFILTSIITLLLLVAELWREGRIVWFVIAVLPIVTLGGLIIFAIRADRKLDQKLAARENKNRERERISLQNFIRDRVTFTVYRPKAVQPDAWYPMLLFAFRMDPDCNDEQCDAPPPEVSRQADAYFGDSAKDFPPTAQETDLRVPRGAAVRVVPAVDGLEFNPPSRLFLWKECLHREEFRFRAVTHFDGLMCSGSVRVYLRSLLIAELPLSILVDSIQSPPPNDCRAIPEYGRRYRRIFVSYSHKDTSVVNQITELARALGDRFLCDVTDLRGGQDWNAELLRLIDEADIFQLFWSSNSMYSDNVRKEWEHALSLHREHFIRPVYWEEPMPTDTAKNLPPANLLRFHFQKLAFSRPSVPAMMSGGPVEGSARAGCFAVLAMALGIATTLLILLVSTAASMPALGSYRLLILFVLLLDAAVVAGCVASLITYDKDVKG